MTDAPGNIPPTPPTPPTPQGEASQTAPAEPASAQPESATVEGTPVGATIAPQPPRKKVPLAVKILSAVLAAALALGAYFGVRVLLESLGGPSKQALIEKGVEEALDAFDPPRQIDQVTVLTDVTAEQNAIHYHYTLVDVDPSAVTEEVLEGVVLPGLCSTKETRQVLDQDVNMKYTYTVESTGDEYALEFSKSDC